MEWRGVLILAAGLDDELPHGIGEVHDHAGFGRALATAVIFKLDQDFALDQRHDRFGVVAGDRRDQVNAVAPGAGAVGQVGVSDVNTASNAHVQINRRIPPQAGAVGADRFDGQVLDVARRLGLADQVEGGCRWCADTAEAVDRLDLDLQRASIQAGDAGAGAVGLDL